MPAHSKREQIVSVALKLFYQNGFHATGIDRIIKEAGVSKKTLYNHFKSKDELVLAALRKRDELFRNNLMRKTERLGSTAKERLLSVFDAIGEWLHEKDFAGCMFINASAEYSETNNPSHILCAEHKRLVREYIRDLAVQAEMGNPEELSQQLNLLIEGAIVDAHVSGNKDAADQAKKIALILVNQNSSKSD
ncbi:MAG: TetR/AcrR family transcriptional regulator [Proteobacteria bacterium]|nr:TetR/AcrR family transcriptional regulator [Pseudomonadota bacterium]